MGHRNNFLSTDFNFDLADPDNMNSVFIDFFPTSIRCWKIDRTMIKICPITVDVNVDVRDLREISELTMTFRVDLYFTQLWNDPRLIMNENYTHLVDWTTLNPEFIDKIWRPDTYFSNVLEATAPPKDDDSFTHKSFLGINGKGDVCFSQRLSLTAACFMRLRNYPFDYQMCKLFIESYGLELKSMEYKWKGVKSVTMSNISLPDFKVVNFSTSETTVFYDGEFSQLRLCFLFERKTAFYFMELYVPAILIVVAAWLATVGKSSNFSDVLGVLLAQLFLYFSYITVMPKVSDIKAMDIFLAGCFAFIFFALLQTFINTEENLYEPQKTVKVSPCLKSTPEENVLNKKAKQTLMKTACKRVTLNNFIFYAMYPTAFILFCVFYFIACMYFLHDHSKMEVC